MVCSVPGSYKQFATLTSIEEGTGIPAADEMIRLLVEAQGTVVRTSVKVFRLASVSGDEPSSDLLTQRMQIHEKNAWMLRSLLD